MKQWEEHFMFESSERREAQNGFVATVPAGIVSTSDLLKALYDVLRLPGYFGFNWNALSDCLRDLHWITEHDVWLVHADVPTIPSDDLLTYLDVLSEAAVNWGDTDEGHRFIPAFPLDAREQLSPFLSKLQETGGKPDDPHQG